jgi:small-conductance mechanosensitive channel/CRP-like cAMP-binding protein
LAAIANRKSNRKSPIANRKFAVSNSFHLIAGAIALVGTAVLLGLTGNRAIRGKLRLSMWLFGAYVALNLFLARDVGPDLEERLKSIEALVFALATISLVVPLLINPFREDRIPERFPTIVQDAIVFGLFLVIATFVMREKFLTTSAVGAVVLGFALQDTLGNMFAGLAIQVEKPFRPGHWISVANYEGVVAEITWRATKLRTKSGNFIILPNNIISKEAITNFSEPATSTRLSIEVSVSYDTPPNEVKAAIHDALADDPVVLKTPGPDVVIADFGSSGLVYRVKFWVGDYALDDVARDRVRGAIYYTFKRRHIEIPYPIQVEYERTESKGRPDERAVELERIAGNVDLLGALSDAERSELVAASAERLYGAGESIVQQGQPGSSMFVICSGRARVTVGPTNQEVAVLEPGGYFGEMSLLTGEPRSAAVIAIGDCVLLEITADTFRRVVLENPAILERVTSVVEERRAGLERTKLAVVTPVAVQEARRSLLSRVQQFLRLSGG